MLSAVPTKTFRAQSTQSPSSCRHSAPSDGALSIARSKDGTLPTWCTATVGTITWAPSGIVYPPGSVMVLLAYL